MQLSKSITTIILTLIVSSRHIPLIHGDQNPTLNQSPFLSSVPHSHNIVPSRRVLVVEATSEEPEQSAPAQESNKETVEQNEETQVKEEEISNTKDDNAKETETTESENETSSNSTLQQEHENETDSQQQQQQQEQQDQQQPENQNKTDVQPETNNQVDKEKRNNNTNTTALILLGLIAALGIGKIWKKIIQRRQLYAGRWIVGSQDPDGCDDNDAMYNSHSFKGRGADNCNSPGWVSKEDDWDWEDHPQKDLEMGVISSSNTAQGTSSHHEYASLDCYPSASSSTNSHKTFLSSTSATLVKRQNSASNRSSNGSSIANNVNLDSISKEEHYPVVQMMQSHAQIESYPIQVSTQQEHDSWDDESDWEDDKEEKVVKVETLPISTSAMPMPSSATHTTSKKPVVSTHTSLDKHESKMPSVDEILREQFHHGQHPVITSLSVAKPTASHTKKTKVSTQEDLEQDDIFASMGLSSIPKKIDKAHPHSHKLQHTVPNVNAMKSSPPNTITTVTTTSTISTQQKVKQKVSSFKESIDTGDGGSDWGDDGDLDDLLMDDA